MEVDSEKLLYKIQARSAIYDHKDKDHADKVVIENLWREIAAEMKSSVMKCKNKWTSLRSSYCRYLREKRTNSTGLGGKRRKKWYLADAMHFLKPYINHQRSNNSDGPDMEDFTDEIMKSEYPDSLSEIAQSNTQSTPSSRSNSPLTSKKPKILLTEMVAAPMIEYLKAKTKNKPEETGNALFFRALAADCEKLNQKRQRAFKMHMLNKMHELLEEQENEAKQRSEQIF